MEGSLFLPLCEGLHIERVMEEAGAKILCFQDAFSYFIGYHNIIRKAILSEAI